MAARSTTFAPVGANVGHPDPQDQSKVTPIRRTFLGRASILPGTIQGFLQNLSTKSNNLSNKLHKLQAEEQQDIQAYFNEKWGGPLIIGVFPILLYTLVLIIAGSYVVNKTEGTCGYPLAAFISGTIALGYLFLLVYSWVFIGDTIKYKQYTLLSPFASLHSLIVWYRILSIASLICFGIGTFYLKLSSFCIDTTPTMYYYSYTIIVMYWLGAAIVAFQIIKIHYGLNFIQSVKNYDKFTAEDVEADIFAKKFNMFIDKKKSTFEIPSSSLGPLLKELMVPATEEDLVQWQKMLDVRGTGVITKDVLLLWYQQRMSKERSGKGGGGSRKFN